MYLLPTFTVLWKAATLQVVVNVHVTAQPSAQCVGVRDSCYGFDFYFFYLLCKRGHLFILFSLTFVYLEMVIIMYLSEIAARTENLKYKSPKTVPKHHSNSKY